MARTKVTRREFLKAAGIAGASLAAASLAGCAAPTPRAVEETAVAGAPPGVEKVVMRNHLIHMESETLSVDLNPATLETTLLRKDRSSDRVFISQAVSNEKKFDVNLDDRSILYPQDNLRMTFDLDEKGLQVAFYSLIPQAITWPSVSMQKESTSLIWPHFEGNYIPLQDTIWIDYLKSGEWNTTQGQYLPF